MIYGSRDTESLLRNAIPRDQASSVAICNLNEINDFMSIDPETKDPRIEAFVISSKDVKSRIPAENFANALKKKHPDAKIVYICKNSKPDSFVDNRGISKYLTKPRPQEVADAIFALSAQLSDKPVIKSSAAEAAKLDVKKARVAVDSMLDDEMKEEKPKVEETEIDFNAEAILAEIKPEPQEVRQVKAKEPELVTRMRNAQSVADVAGLVREINAETILKDLARDNASYEVIENKLTALKEEINHIMLDNKLSMEQRLSKIRSVCYNSKYFAVQSGTIIEEYVKQIIETITSSSVSMLNERLAEIDESIKLSTRYGNGNQNFGRLSGINEERSNVIMELSTLKVELQEIAIRVSDTIHELTANVAAKNQELTGNDIVDNNIRAHGTFLTNGESIELLRNMLLTADTSNDDFKEAVHCVTAMLEAYNKLIGLDKEQIAATNEMIKYIQANNIEDTVVANTLLKKSLRVFAADEGVGRTIIPYLLSQRKSKQNCNVLLIDLTGTCKAEDYGLKYYALEDYRINRYEKDFVAVRGTCTTVESAQNLSAILTRAADFYRVINVVLPTDNKEIFDILAQDVLCINYVTNTKKRNMEHIKKFMASTHYENVAKRLIVNDSSAALNELSNYFDLLNRLDCQLLSIKHVPQIELCSLSGIDPVTIDAVEEALVEVSKYA